MKKIIDLIKSLFGKGTVAEKAIAIQELETEVKAEVEIVKEAVKGKIVIGTFSTEGPRSCSGLKITQYDEPNLVEKFKSIGFRKNNCKIEEHKTPSSNLQEFIFCAFTNL